MQRTIVHKWFYTHPPETVWKYLTDSDLLAEWLMPNDFKPIVGHNFQLTARPKAKLSFDGNIYCTVLEVKPFERLSYSWKGGSGAEKVTLDSIVTWTLTPKGNGTELLLEHSGFKGIKNYLAYIIMNAGWAKIGRRFTKQINHS